MSGEQGRNEVVSDEFPGKLMNKNDDDDNDDNDDNEMDLELDLLTHQFRGQNFTETWKFLHKVGWEYDAGQGSYKAPALVNGQQQEQQQAHEKQRHFKNAKEVEEFLDKPCLVNIHSNLQSVSNQNCYSYHDEAADLQIARDLRRDILLEMRRKRAQGKAERSRDDECWNEMPDNKSDNNNNNKDRETKERGADTNALRRRSSRLEMGSASAAPNNNNNNNNRSVTALEKGTDLYLHRKKSKTKKKGAPKNVAAASDPDKNNNSSSALLAQKMTLEECMTLTEKVLEQQDDVNGGTIFATYLEKDAMRMYKNEFGAWRFLLSTNHSLLFYGSGSKRKLLTQFAHDELSKEGHVLLIDGFDEAVFMEDIFDLLVQLFLDNKEPLHQSAVPKDDDDNNNDNNNGTIMSAAAAVIGKSTPYRAHPLVERGISIGRAIAHAITKADQEENKEADQEENRCAVLPIFLVIHNLDAPNLADTVAQEALAALVVNSTVANHVASVRLVASVDHIDAPMHLWKNIVTTAANFAWIYKPVHTHCPYTLELSLLSEEERKRRKSSNPLSQTLETVQVGRVLDVLKSLAPRHAEVVQILAKLQLKERQKSWITFTAYFTACKNACAVSKDSQLRQLLTELNDHGLIVNKMEGSSEYVKIPYDDKKLEEILNYNQQP